MLHLVKLPFGTGAEATYLIINDHPLPDLFRRLSTTILRKHTIHMRGSESRGIGTPRRSWSHRPILFFLSHHIAPLRFSPLACRPHSIALCHIRKLLFRDTIHQRKVLIHLQLPRELFKPFALRLRGLAAVLLDGAQLVFGFLLLLFESLI
jgi:hypothetical protein